MLQYKNNTKKLWQVINHVINKSQDKTRCIDNITVNNIEHYMPKKLAIYLDDYFSQCGQKSSFNH